MPIKTVYEHEEDPKTCPRCKGELVAIEGNLVKWLTCTGCKWKKLAERAEKVIKIVPIRDEQASKPREEKKLKVSFD